MSSQRISELVKEIELHNERYYNQNAPTISDFEYDKLVAELRKLDPDNLVLSYLGKPGTFRTVRHSVPMGSLKKAHTDSEVEALFWNGNGGGPASLVAMPKIDGLSMTVVYIEGRLALAATRGDGETGEDVTENARQISNIPEFIETMHKKMEIRGEVYVDRNWFAANMSKTFKNPRNYAAGSLKQKDPNVTAERNLSFVAYRLILGDGYGSLTKTGELELLRKLGFEIPDFQSPITNRVEIINSILHFTNNRASFHYDTDGIVYWIDFPALFVERGQSGFTPNGAIAYKFNTDKAQTRVLDIEWKTSRTGRLIPVMVVEPVELAGTTVSRCTLNNFDFLKKTNIQIGDEVEIEKANEIIPKFVAHLSLGPLRHANTPEKCPACGGALGTRGVDLVCTNENCKAKMMSKLLHFLRALEVEGFSGKSVERLIENLEDRNIFELEDADLRQMGFGPTQSKKLLDQLKNIKSTKAQFLHSLGIPGMGLSNWEKALSLISFDDIVEGKANFSIALGESTAKKAKVGIQDNREFIAEILPFINIIEKPAYRSNHQLPMQIPSLTALSFCITGTLSKPRVEVVNDIETNGGKVTGLSSKTNFLVLGADPGSKLARAQQLKIQIISETELYDMMSK